MLPLSLAVGSIQLTIASHTPGSVPWVIAVGQSVITGGPTTLMVIVKLQLAVPPAASVTS